MTLNSKTSRRRGTIVHEAAIALLLAAAVLTSFVQVLAFSAQQSRSQQQRLAATREAGDLMEQLMARSWEQLTPEAVAALPLSENCQATLPEARLKVEIESNDVAAPDADAADAAADGDADAAAVGGKRLSIDIGWRSAGGRAPETVHLVAWKYLRLEAVE